MISIYLYLRLKLQAFCAWRADVWMEDAELFHRIQVTSMMRCDWAQHSEARDFYEHALSKSRRWSRRAARLA